MIKPIDTNLAEQLKQIPGFVREVAQYTLTQAHYPNEILAYAGAIVLQGSLAGRKVKGPGGERPNIYLLNLAHTGTGKQSPIKTNKRVLMAADLESMLCGKIASGVALQDRIIRNPQLLLQIDEFHHIIRGMGKGGNDDSKAEYLLEIWGAADEIYQQRDKAGGEETKSIDQPSLSLFGSATVEGFWGSVTDTMVEDGLIPRCIVIEAKAERSWREIEEAELPESIVNTAKWWKAYEPARLPSTPKLVHPSVVPYGAGAREAIAEGRYGFDGIYDASEHEYERAIWSRAGEKVGKLALIWAISENKEQPVISKDGVEWARKIVTANCLYMVQQCEFCQGSSQFMRWVAKLRRKLRYNGGSMPCRAAQRDIGQPKDVAEKVIEFGKMQGIWAVEWIKAKNGRRVETLVERAIEDGVIVEEAKSE